MTAATGYNTITANVAEIGKGRNQEKIRRVKSLIIETAATADAGDTVAITLADYGITTVQAVHSWVHTTSNSVIETESNTCAVASGVLTVTITAGTDNDIRVIQVFYT